MTVAGYAVKFLVCGLNTEGPHLVMVTIFGLTLDLLLRTLTI